MPVQSGGPVRCLARSTARLQHIVEFGQLALGLFRRDDEWALLTDGRAAREKLGLVDADGDREHERLRLLRVGVGGALQQASGDLAEPDGQLSAALLPCEARRLGSGAALFRGSGPRCRSSGCSVVGVSGGFALVKRRS